MITPPPKQLCYNNFSYFFQKCKSHTPYLMHCLVCFNLINHVFRPNGKGLEIIVILIFDKM